MHLASALVASAWALHTSAFLIPLEVSKAAQQANPETESLVAGASHTLDLDCPGCLFFGIEDNTEPELDVENKIRLEFDVDATGDLTINGQSPRSDDNSPFILTAPQVRVEDGQQTRPIQLDFVWTRLPAVTAEEDPNVTLLPFEFTILGLESNPVMVDTVTVLLLSSSDTTFIAKVDLIPFKNTPGATTCDSSEWSLCRLRAIIQTRLQAMFQAAKGRAQAAKGWVKGQAKGCRGKFGHKSGPGGMRHGHGHGHHGHHHHHNAHRFGRMLHQTLRFFVIPALLGVIGGLMASAIGMLVGQFIAYLWIRFHRGGRRGNASVVEIVVEEDEKDALLVEDEVSPPQYDDLDVEVVVIEDEKH